MLEVIIPLFSPSSFFLSFVAIGTDAVKDLLRNSAFPCICACVGGEKGVPQEYAPYILLFLRRKQLLDNSREHKQSNLAVTDIRAWLLSCVEDLVKLSLAFSPPQLSQE